MMVSATYVADAHSLPHSPVRSSAGRTCLRRAGATGSTPRVQVRDMVLCACRGSGGRDAEGGWGEHDPALAVAGHYLVAPTRATLAERCRGRQSWVRSH